MNWYEENAGPFEGLCNRIMKAARARACIVLLVPPEPVCDGLAGVLLEEQGNLAKRVETIEALLTMVDDMQTLLVQSLEAARAGRMRPKEPPS